MQQLEQALQALPAVEEAYVVPVRDEEIGRRVGVIGRFCGTVTLRDLRVMLAGSVAEFMLPAVLRTMAEGEVFPRTHSGKIDKNEVVDAFFPMDPECALRAGVEFWKPE